MDTQLDSQLINMDLQTVALIVGVNLLAIAVGLQRLDTQGLLRLDSFLPYQLLGQPCGLCRDGLFAVVSDRLVLPTGVVPGAGIVLLYTALHRLEIRQMRTFKT